MGFSTVGRKKVASHGFLLFLDIIVLALASKVNKFNEFFYVADLFPLALSIITLVVLFVMISIDLAVEDSWVGRPQTEIIVLGVLSIFWLSFNSFSTSRWTGIPMNCGSIPGVTSDEIAWCRDVHALKAFIWITFVACALITIWTVRFCASQYKNGQKHIFAGPLSRFSPRQAQYNREPREFVRAFEKY